MPTLSVSIDHVATLRQAGGGSEPDPVQAAVLAELAGARGITVNLREDRMHVQDRDVYLLKQVVTTSLNLAVAPTPEMVGLAVDVLPHVVTLVPGHRDERGADEALQVRGHENELAKTVAMLQDNNIEACMFVDPEVQQVKASKRVGATCVLLNTSAYAQASGGAVAEQLERLRDAAFSAQNLGLTVGVGRGISYHNIDDIAQLRRSDGDLVDEVVVGHAVVARAALVGVENAVRDMLTLL